MRLLYCYIQFLDDNGKPTRYHGQYQVEMNFSTTANYSYDASANVLLQENRKNPLPVNFWTEENSQAAYQNIYNINVIAGDNGAGKTTAIRCILNLLDLFYAAADKTMTPARWKRVQGMADHRALLLMEDNHKLYLLNYIPENLINYIPAKPETKGFIKDQLRIYTCRNYTEFSERTNSLRNKIASLLLKTKIIHMTNTLTQYDYERHIGEQGNRLRDYFIYDVSLGATIGSNIGQFFLYDVYKQVKYVFDKNQVVKRQELEEKTDIFQSIMPSSLRLRLRIDQYKNDFIQLASRDQLDLLNLELPMLLGILCVSAFADNLGIRLSNGTLPVKNNNLFDYVSNYTFVCNELKTLIKNLQSRFNATVRALSPTGHNEAVTCLSVLPDKRIVSGSADGTLILWDPFHETFHNNYPDSVSFVNKEHTDEITCLSVLPDKQQFVSGSADGTIRVWSTISNECLHVLELIRGNKITSIIPLPDGHTVISNSSDGILRSWDIDTKRILVLFNSKNANTIDIGNVSCATALPNTSFIVSGTTNGKVLIYDYNTGHKWIMTDSHPGRITCITALSDHETFISCSADGSIMMWKPLVSNSLRSWAGSFGITTVAASSSGNLFVTGTTDGTLQFWNSNKADCLLTKREHTDMITCLTVLDDGHIVSGSRDNTIRIYKPYSYECKVLDQHNDAVNCLAVLSDNQIVSGSADKSIHIWDVDFDRPELLFILQKYDNLLNNGLIGQLLRYESKDSPSDPAVKSKKQQRQEILSFAETLAKYCLNYINYLYKEGTMLFNQFVRLDENSFELPLLSFDEKDDTYQNLITFIQVYRYTCEPAYTIDFDWGLSSGQENMLRIFSNLYHVFDRDYSSGKYGDYTIYNNERHVQGRSGKRKCDTVLLFMDEADLTLHPDWQRQLVAILTAYIPRIYPASCVQNIQLILSTHSPLLLGDIPNENITYLYSQENQISYLQEDDSQATDTKQINRQSSSSLPEQTFGQNIHNILKDGFSLRKGTIGAFAAQKINNAAERLNEIIDHVPNNNTDIDQLENELDNIRPIVNLVAPGVLRIQMENLFQKATIVLCKQKDIQHSQAKQVLQALWNLPQEEQDYVHKVLNQEIKEK